MRGIGGVVHEEFQWQGGKTIEPKTKPREIHEPILTREIIQDIPHRLILKHQHPSKRHNQTSNQTQPRRKMRHPRKPINRRLLQRPINQQRIVMAHKRKTYDPDGLEDAKTRGDETDGRTAVFFGGMWALTDDSEDDDDHAYEGEGRGFGEFGDVAVEGEWVGDESCAEDDDDLSVYEDGEDG